MIGMVARRAFVVGIFVLAAGLLAASFLLRSATAWWSGTLDNVGVVLLLLVPGEFALSRLRTRLTRVAQGVERAVATSEAALASATQAQDSLAQVREVLLGRQHDELDRELDVFRRLVSAPSREAAIEALLTATKSGVLSSAGVRVPVWETNLHYRFVVRRTSPELVVQLERDDGEVLSAHEWEPGASPAAFFQRLVEAVRSANSDLGVGLNDPTESVQALSDMLVDVTRLRAQVLMGHRGTLRDIIERRNGWYFTEHHVLPAEDLHYGIAVTRLGELDWEEHLRAKGWHDAGDALAFAHRLYGQ